jgi:hypothetical protein
VSHSSELGPMEIFEANALEMSSFRSEVTEAKGRQNRLKSELIEAERETRLAVSQLNEFGVPILNNIHDSVDDRTDPADYLQAVLSMHVGAESGREVIEQQVTPFRERVKELSVPIGIIGSGSALFGMSAGDLVVRRVRQEPYIREEGPDVLLGIVPEIPLLGVSQIRNGLSHSSPARIEELSYTSEKRGLFRTYQNLFDLRFAGDVDSIRGAFNAEAPNFSTHVGADNTYHNVKISHGTLPVVAYGEGAVVELMIAISEGRGIGRQERLPDSTDIAALAISLGILPTKVQEVDEDSLKEVLKVKIVEALTKKTRSLIGDESRRREDPNSHIDLSRWETLLSPSVVAYSGLKQAMLENALVVGVENTIRALRSGDPDDCHTFNEFNNRPEHRLLLTEAQKLLVGVISERYGVEIDPTKLISGEVVRRLAEQLSSKKKDKELYEEIRKKRSW